jgi:hypothetical protein
VVIILGLVGLRKRAALILTIIAVVAFTLTLNIGNVYAATPETVTLNPNPAPPGTPVTATGSGFATCPSTNTPPCDVGRIYLTTGHVFTVSPGLLGCSGSVIGGASSYYVIHVENDGNFVVTGISTTGLSVGTYCVLFTDFDSSTQTATTLTVGTTPIPEYPFGLAVLAIFMIIAYGVIRRKTATKQK